MTDVDAVRVGMARVAAVLTSTIGTSWDNTPFQRRDGTRSVSVTRPAGEHHFRYLATGGVWFDDHTADGVDSSGGIIRL